jgi:hypothetical protein
MLMSICDHYIIPDRHHTTKLKREPLMSLLRPLDPVFPIERQIAIDAGPVVLVNVFTLGPVKTQTRRKQCRIRNTYLLGAIYSPVS